MGKKADRLDNAFLFALSFIGLLITFIQTRQDLSGLIEAIPYLLLGIAWPFYVGYLWGSIEKDSTQERLRGWIYLVMGTTSYFAFFTSTWLVINYPGFLIIHSWILVGFVLSASSFLVHALVRWTRKVFRRFLNQYALSGTVSSAFSLGFVLTMVMSLYRDLSGRDLLAMLSTGSTELLFWATVVVTAFLIVLIYEKASRDAIDPVALPRLRFKRITDFFMVKGLYLGAVLMEYTIDFNLKARMLWILSYTMWFTACLFWVAHFSFMSQVLFASTLLVEISAGVIFYRTKTIDFVGIENRSPEKISYCLIAFALMWPMIYIGFSLVPALTLVMFTVYSLLRVVTKTREARVDGQTQ